MAFWTAAALAAFALCALASAARGATVAVTEADVAQVEFQAAPGESNRLTVTATEGPARLVFRDLSATIAPGTGCTGGGGAGVAVKCTIPSGPTVSRATVFAALDDGDDQLDASALPRPFNGGSLVSEFKGEAGADAILGGQGTDKIAPGPGDDRVVAGLGDDYLVADSTPDGTDLVQGGGGRDFASYGGRVDPVRLSIAGAANDGASGERDSLVEVEGLSGGVGADTLVGSRRADFLMGSGGGDRIVGGGSGDLVDSGSGGDTVLGDAGNDILRGAGDSDLLKGAEGDDSLYGGRGADRVRGAQGADVLVGNAGSDLLGAGPGPDRINAVKGTTVPDAPADRDATRDRIDCGLGSDRLSAEPRDHHRRCERVSVAAPRT